MALEGCSNWAASSFNCNVGAIITWDGFQPPSERATWMKNVRPLWVETSSSNRSGSLV